MKMPNKIRVNGQVYVLAGDKPRKGDIVMSAFGEKGIINSTKGQTAYVDYGKGSFEPVFFIRMKQTGRQGTKAVWKEEM